MDSLDVNTPHYEKKIADLQRRLDSQYDTIDETEHAIEEVKTQIFDLKKSSIFADNIYEFLLHFDEIYRECTDAEKKKFMQSFVDRIELYLERRKDGNIRIKKSENCIFGNQECKHFTSLMGG